MLLLFNLIIFNSTFSPLFHAPKNYYLAIKFLHPQFLRNFYFKVFCFPGFLLIKFYYFELSIHVHIRFHYSNSNASSQLSFNCNLTAKFLRLPLNNKSWVKKCKLILSWFAFFVIWGIKIVLPLIINHCPIAWSLATNAEALIWVIKFKSILILCFKFFF